MIDLVKRLREGVDWNEGEPHIVVADIDMNLAADRIEALEAVLRQAREAMVVLHSGPFGVKSGASVQAIAAIDAALKE